MHIYSYFILFKNYVTAVETKYFELDGTVSLMALKFINYTILCKLLDLFVPLFVSVKMMLHL